MRIRLASVLLCSLALVACGDNNSADDDTTTDAPRIDAPAIDAPDVDAPDIDAPDIDAAIDAPDIDAPIDAAIDAAIDAQIDAAIDAPIDAPPTSSELIGFARAASPGTGLSLPIMGATVTYLKPAIGNPTNDPAGFTIQASQAGPALMVAVDPATLTPAPAVGDVVSFTITDMVTTGGQPRATVITGYMRTATGTDVNPLVQNVSAATDLLTNIGGYDSELIDVSGSITGTFGASGSGFERAQINTAGMTAADTNFQLRVPATFRDANDMAMGCNFALNNVPVGRFNAQTQLPAFVAGDITLSNCPAPVVMAAVATAGTTVQITFSRNILASSFMASGSQFTIDNGLTVMSASLSGRVVTLTTSAQTNALYTVTVMNTLTDLQGTALGTPNTGMFAGFVTPAVLRINEVNANIASSCDLIELRVVSGGSLGGMRMQERDTENVLTFPSVIVATNDLIIIHENGASATCNPTGAVSETTGIAQFPTSAVAQNYDTAWDFWSTTDTGLTFSDTVLTLFSSTNTITEVVFLSDDPAGTAAVGTETAAAAAATANQWQMVGGGVPAGGFIDDNFNAHAALDLNATGTNATGNTIQRLDNTDDNDKADWNMGATLVQPHTWAALNVGQTPF